MSPAGYDLKFTFEAIWKVLVASVILGAGLPMLFAVGVRSLAWGAGGDTATDTNGAAAHPNPAGKVLAVIIFAVVLYVIAAGIVYVIATGKGSNYDITFRNVIPEIYKKS